MAELKRQSSQKPSRGFAALHLILASVAVYSAIHEAPPSGQSPAQADHAKPKGRFTGERLKILRPDVYRRVIELLAEPREQVPYDHICRLLHVSEHTVAAIEKSQAVPIAERKERLLAKALRIADKAADRIEDQIDTANITQATVAFGVATEKILTFGGRPRSSRQLQPDRPQRSVRVAANRPRDQASLRPTARRSSLRGRSCRIHTRCRKWNCCGWVRRSPSLGLKSRVNFHGENQAVNQASRQLTNS